jgi:hypothetical protein
VPSWKGASKGCLRVHSWGGGPAQTSVRRRQDPRDQATPPFQGCRHGGLLWPATTPRGGRRRSRGGRHVMPACPSGVPTPPQRPPHRDLWGHPCGAPGGGLEGGGLRRQAAAAAAGIPCNRGAFAPLAQTGRAGSGRSRPARSQVHCCAREGMMGFVTRLLACLIRGARAARSDADLMPRGHLSESMGSTHPHGNPFQTLRCDFRAGGISLRASADRRGTSRSGERRRRDQNMI